MLAFPHMAGVAAKNCIHFLLNACFEPPHNGKAIQRLPIPAFKTSHAYASLSGRRGALSGGHSTRVG